MNMEEIALNAIEYGVYLGKQDVSNPRNIEFYYYQNNIILIGYGNMHTSLMTEVKIINEAELKHLTNENIDVLNKLKKAKNN